MRHLVFAKNINGSETGLIDISTNPPSLFCLCEENIANEILVFKIPFNKMALENILDFSRLNEHMNTEDTIKEYFEI